ncbi:hypothetical protein Q7C_1599 [Methylophaga frappieri]|uniref:Uncharacterized protein n=1 Tax=Methylophaga frappieri (strain ATCC BAA-2434 / DSM 25690 / JAM7) TaxID=754477 RepID=I1YIK5_METFJ|nr:hypothetical protein [Methylophaga frappieri]AFJ02748.1 hypothetical protein Q7C_1599 [Methylophaga frappieri]
MPFRNVFRKRQAVRLAFRPDRLEALIRQGKLHAADFNCLDASSKRSVWSMLLSAAARRTEM